MSETKAFEPEQTWSALERRLETETDPRRRHLLEQVRDHVRAEIGGEIDPLMATLTGEPEYHFRGIGFDMGPKGRENVRPFYKDMIAGGGNRFHFDVQRIVVDHDTVVTEGKMRTVVDGAGLIATGVSEVDGEPVIDDGRYISESLILTVWPADADGKLIGEDIWFGTSPSEAKRTRL